MGVCVYSDINIDNLISVMLWLNYKLHLFVKLNALLKLLQAKIIHGLTANI